ncbi:MAG: hypothetical protein ACR2GJ_06960 [Gemmatimonadaceae bacterium]|jgi:hypothetical protein
MDNYRIRWSGLALVAALAAGCGSEGDKLDDTTGTDGVAAGGAGAAAGPVAGGSGLRWRNDAYRELDGDDENAERLVATVSSGPLDSMVVRLEVRTSKDGLLYAHEWPAISYMKYKVPGSAKDSAAVLIETERQMAKIFSDSAFIVGSAAPRYSGKREADLDAIRYDIAEHQYRETKALKRADPLPPRAHDEITVLARAVPLARIQAVAADTRNMPAFKYYAGGEETYVIAWSTSEGRMVRIAACC